MEWLLGWLQTQLTLGQAWRFILICEAIDFIWSFSMATVFHFLRIKISENTMKYRRSKILQWSFPFRIFKAVALEEIFFRFLPLTAAILIWGASWPTVVVALVSSIIFGWFHGNGYNILIQGVGGLLFGIIFLKCGGFNHHFFQALLFSVAAHGLFNGLLALFIVFTERPEKPQEE